MKVLDTVELILREKQGEMWSISPDATVYEALEIMSDKEVGALLVLERGHVVGILSERDYARKIILKNRSSRDTKVREIMNAPAVTVSPACTVDEAMQLMTDRRIRHLPVVDSVGRLLGIISIGDLVKWTITSHEKTIEQLQNYITG
ncbi:MAG: CBS domain-containing protein [Acidobacteriaceae bacterium]|nr:CBS domain-containing protein [Acidobacteriaceae bacterium]MBV8569704.1 CBS domain-containing protein [Acidobacteriaceae bacterium]